MTETVYPNKENYCSIWSFWRQNLTTPAQVINDALYPAKVSDWKESFPAGRGLYRYEKTLLPIRHFSFSRIHVLEEKNRTATSICCWETEANGGHIGVTT